MELHVHLVSELMFGHRQFIYGNGTEPAIFVPKQHDENLDWIIIRDDTCSKQWNRK